MTGTNFASLPFQHWKISQSRSLGAVYEKEVHMIDYCAFVLGGRPVNIVYQSAAPIVMKIIDRRATLPDAEAVSFSVGNTRCQLAFVNVVDPGRESLRLKFVGTKYSYILEMVSQNKIQLLVTDGGKIKARRSALVLDCYRQESKVFLSSILHKNSRQVIDYQGTRHLCLEIIRAIKKI